MGTSFPRLPADWNPDHKKQRIQVLWPNPALHQTVVIGAASAVSAAIPAGAVVQIESDVDCFVRFGDGAVVALLDDLPLWSKTPQTYNMKTSTHIAGITTGGAGKLYITVLE